MGGKSAPKAPDYRGAAEAQGQSSKENTAYATYANRPDQYNPWGSTTWDNRQVYDPATGQNVTQWSQNTTLDPELQKALDSQIALQRQRSEQAQGMYGRAAEAVSDPFDPNLTGWGKAPGSARQGMFNRSGDVNQGYMDNDQINALRQKSEDAMYQRQANRLDPQWEQAAEAKKAELVGQGLRPGSAMWDREMANFDKSRSDAYEQARLGSIGEGRNEYSTMFGTGLQAQQFGNQAAQQNWQNALTGRGFNNQVGQQGFQNRMQNANYQNQLRQAQLQEQLAMRNQPLNEINAFLSGQQVQAPNFNSFGQAGTADTTDYMGAATNQYGAAQDAYNARQMGMQGLFSGLGMLGGMFSDRRLKRNIRKIGESSGLNLYAYEYVWGQPAVGFMADEVAELYPHAVVTHESGFDMVDYGAIK